MIDKERNRKKAVVCKRRQFFIYMESNVCSFFRRILYTFKNVSAIIGLLQDYDKERSSGNAGQKTVYGKFLYTG